MDIKLALMCGIDIPIPECQLTIHQPTLKEISYIGEEDFFAGVQCLCLNKNLILQDEAVISNTTNFQIFMTIMQEKQALEKQIAVQQVLVLLFPDYKISFTPRSILFLKNTETINVDEENFEFLQQTISNVCCLKSNNNSNQQFNPANKKAKEIADKLMHARKRVAAQKNVNQGSIFGQYISVLTVGIGSMSLNDVINLTIYQLYDLIERLMLHTSWDLDMKCRLAGSTSEKQPEDWMKNIH